MNTNEKNSKPQSCRFIDIYSFYIKDYLHLLCMKKDMLFFLKCKDSLVTPILVHDKIELSCQHERCDKLYMYTERLLHAPDRVTMPT